jgi:hypothetical protein
MFEKKVFQLTKPCLANFHSTKKHSFLECQKYAEFYPDFKSVEIVGKKCTPKKLAVYIKENKLQFSTLFLPLTFFLANGSHFSQQIRNQRKILHYFDTHGKIL